jgi:aspartyl protease family protein
MGLLTWELSNGTLTISGEDVMPNYIHSGLVPWAKYTSSITAIIIEDGVKSIGNHAFAYCDKLISVTIPESVEDIGISAFVECHSLTSITIPTSVTIIRNTAFWGCTNLTSVAIPKILTSIGYYAFYGCSNMKVVSKDETAILNQDREKVLKSKTVIKMKKEGGVYRVPCRINDFEMEFIFDTGASDISISLIEAMFLLKQRKLNEEDFIGTERYNIADGSIQEGTVVNLKTVEIGDMKLTNVKASISHNMTAPLLLGQSALSQFGKYSIDNKRQELTLERN